MTIVGFTYSTKQQINKIFTEDPYDRFLNYSQSPFSKHGHFIKLRLSKDLYVYDLENSKITFHKKLDYSKSRALLIDNEKIIATPNTYRNKEYIFFLPQFPLRKRPRNQKTRRKIL